MKKSWTLGDLVLRLLIAIAVLLVVFFLLQSKAISIGELFSSGSYEPIIVTVELDVSKPRYTEYSLFISPGSRVTFSASGLFTWDPKAQQGPAGPEGAKIDGELWYPVVYDSVSNRYYHRVAYSDDFFMPYEPICVLIAKVGGQRVVVGKGGTFVFTVGGHLRLAINERWLGRKGKSHLGNWADNHGVISVRMEIN